MKRKRYTKMDTLNYFQKRAKDNKIDLRIEELKRELKNVQEDYYRRVYVILKEILNLRKQQIKGYGLNNLAKEKGIELTAHQVNYIFGYEHISSHSKQLMDRGRIKPSTLLFIIKQSNKFREATYQDKVVDMYLDGKLKTTEISRMSAENILNNIITSTEVSRADKSIVHFIGYLSNILKDLRSRENLFTDRKALKMIKSLCEKIISEVERIEKFGKNLKGELKVKESYPISFDEDDSVFR